MPLQLCALYAPVIGAEQDCPDERASYAYTFAVTDGDNDGGLICSGAGFSWESIYESVVTINQPGWADYTDEWQQGNSNEIISLFLVSIIACVCFIFLWPKQLCMKAWLFSSKNLPKIISLLTKATKIFEFGMLQK